MIHFVAEKSFNRTVAQSGRFTRLLSSTIFLASPNNQTFITVKTKGKDANGRPSILGLEEIEIPPQFRLMASDVSIDTRKLVFSQSKHYNFTL